jgi:hypothetical protein
MIFRLLLSGLMMALLFSCSSDDSDDGGDSGSNTIVGTWDAVTLQLDSASQEEQSVADLFNLLAAQECYLISMILEEDKDAILITSINYLDFSGLFLGSLNFECPTESDSENGTYVYANGQLTITDSSGLTNSVEAALSGDRLTLVLEGDEFDELGASGSLIFERR